MSIHPTAIIDDNADIHPSARIDAYVVIEGPVQVEADCHVYPFAFLTGPTRIGRGCEIHPGAVVGHIPQDLAYQGGESRCVIGDETIIREGASVHRGTDPGSETIVGKRCYLMANAHVAHNCRLGDDVKMANGTALAGHVHIGDGAFLSGGAMVHQFVRIGELVMVGGLAKVVMDVPPFFLTGRQGEIAGINVVGLRRAGHDVSERQDVKTAYRILYRSGRSMASAVSELEAAVTTPLGRKILDFVQAPSKRGIATASSLRQKRASRSGAGDGVRSA